MPPRSDPLSLPLCHTVCGCDRGRTVTQTCENMLRLPLFWGRGGNSRYGYRQSGAISAAERHYWGSNSPALTPRTNASHSSWVKTSAVRRFESLVSRTVTEPPGICPTSTQSPIRQKLLIL